jgi:hypothetical protein
MRGQYDRRLGRRGQRRRGQSLEGVGLRDDQIAPVVALTSVEVRQDLSDLISLDSRHTVETSKESTG